MSEKSEHIEDIVNKEYKYGFKTELEAGTTVKGLSEETIRFISAHKKEPEWMLDYRLKAFAQLQKMTEPDWAHLKIEKIDYQKII